MDTIRKISRGQVWFLVDPTAPTDYDGNIQGKNRPVLVISNDACNQSSPIVHIIPLTSQVKKPLPVHVTFNDGKMDQIILCEQTRPVKENLFYDKSYYKYTLSEEIMRQVDEAMAVQFGLSLIMPNSDRFWKSIESAIRFKVKEAIKYTKADALDFVKLSASISNTIEQSVKQEIDNCEFELPEIYIEEQPRTLCTGTSPQIIEELSAQPQSQPVKRTKWTDEMKRDFCDTYYKFGPQAAADKYCMKLGSAYRQKWTFEKELKEVKQ